jgi:hypothetical protein
MPVLQPLAPGVPTQELSTGRRRAQVVALSSDTGRAVEGLIDKHDLTFPVGYGPTPGTSPNRQERSSTTIRCTCSPPVSSSTLTGG